MARQTYQLIPSRDIDGQRNLESDWPKSTPGHTQPIAVFLCYLPLMVISIHKNYLKRSIGAFQFYC